MRSEKREARPARPARPANAQGEKETAATMFGNSVQRGTVMTTSASAAYRARNIDDVSYSENGRTAGAAVSGAAYSEDSGSGTAYGRVGERYGSENSNENGSESGG